MKKIIFTIPAQADVRRIDRETAMRILTALHRFAETGEGDVKKLQGESGEAPVLGTLPAEKWECFFSQRRLRRGPYFHHHARLDGSQCLDAGGKVRL